jgi:hemerythrin
VAYLDWSVHFSVNINEIDEQHRKLMEMINTLHEAMVARQGREAQKIIIAAMVDYAHNHFALEERYMRESTFPWLRRTSSNMKLLPSRRWNCKKR